MKKTLRENLLRKRDRIKPEKKHAKEASIRKRLYASVDFRKAKSIMFYASFRSEAATMPCIIHALKLKKIVMLPLVDRKKDTLRIFQICDVSDLEAGFMGIPEPKVNRMQERHLNDLDVVIVPGSGFDSDGNRLGYGAGYYDKLLSKSKRNITKIALAFEEQIVQKIPGEKHDVRMDKIITEKRTIDCRKQRLTTENTEVTE
ncbi:MAG: 5-formyltetrahydrofolate cyclo-ligase [Nitrospirae bacterium]|nr:5-formyltetrahydrofolate cyclo-ligase [Nitrospirota bacterium]